MDAEVGLCYLRVPTWCPFRLQFYGQRPFLASRKLTSAGIDLPWPITPLFESTTSRVRKSGRYASAGRSASTSRCLRQCVLPVVETFAQTYHWSLMQTEYSTDLVFRSETALKPIYEQLSRQAVIAVKAEPYRVFWAKK